MLFNIIKPLISGHVGENYVSEILNSLPKDKYKVIDNVMLKTDRGSTQIDHVIVSIYGIFVIETKNYKGLIAGTKYGEYWVQYVYGRKYSFYNPVRQNYGHIKALQGILDLPQNKFISVVVFLHRCDIEGDAVRSVIHPSQLINFIELHKEVKISEMDMYYLTSVIERNMQHGFGAKVKHVINTQSNIYHKEKMIEQGLCPKCDGYLVERNGKYGYFWGCSNYPKCRYTCK